ncbi:ASCH domain-containing protein [Intrasporangium sp.]|uniref:ASCH domain-containing protein n=1 Tax=Intrasporangium sp. TaxID=1925024 RepID=UPI00293A8473|nr:ASCH domain-containing protein [Intrasporangium sp.]MDV3220250.1 ASCH domain-containing protein [Intrasporangium sp.]
MSDPHEANRVTPVDRDAAAELWETYAQAHPQAVRACPDYTVERFGDSDALADELLDLVLTGPKRATAALVADFAAQGDPLPRVGSHWIACDGSGRPRVVLRSVELRLATFEDVDEAFASDEGEGDRTLETWRDGHRRYWVRTCAARGDTWSESDEIVLERFRVVWPPDLAD